MLAEYGAACLDQLTLSINVLMPIKVPLILRARVHRLINMTVEDKPLPFSRT